LAIDLLAPSRLSDPNWRRFVRLLGQRRFGLASGSGLVDWGVDALVAGWESQSLNVMAGLSKPPNEFEVDEYVERMMKELGVQMPEEHEFAKLYGMAVARDMLAGKTTPYEGAGELRNLWVRTGHPEHLVPWAMYEEKYDLARDRVYGEVADVGRDILDEARRMLGEQTECA
jgi:hypothetical protein